MITKPLFIIALLFTLGSIVHAQQVRPTDRPFDGKSHVDYLTAWSKTPDAGAAALLDCAQIAIAADKTQNWDSALMAEIRKALAANPLALARLDAFTQLLGGDTAGAAALCRLGRPEPLSSESMGRCGPARRGLI